jgi:hypothetical protein
MFMYVKIRIIASQLMPEQQKGIIIVAALFLTEIIAMI